MSSAKQGAQVKCQQYGFEYVAIVEKLGNSVHFSSAKTVWDQSCEQRKGARRGAQLNEGMALSAGQGLGIKVS